MRLPRDGAFAWALPAAACALVSCALRTGGSWTPPPEDGSTDDAREHAWDAEGGPDGEGDLDDEVSGEDPVSPDPVEPEDGVEETEPDGPEEDPAAEDPAGEEPAETWLGDWAARVPMTIDPADVDADLADFPFLVHLGTVSGRFGDDMTFIFDALGGDGNRKKIAVTEGDGVTQCFVEIERWDSAAHEAWLWVKAPFVSGASETVFYLYYDAGQPANTAHVDDTAAGNSVNVWDGDALLVCHLDETAGARSADSTANGNDGQPRPGLSMDVEGMMAGGDEFDGVDDAIDLPYLGTETALTVEIWFYGYGPWAEHNPLISNVAWFDGVVHFKVKGSGTTVPGELVATAGSTARIASGIAHPTDRWTYAAYSVDGVGPDTFKLYADGAEVASGDELTEGVDLGLMIGAEVTDRFWSGILDEARISRTARDPAWIRATYESGIDDLVAYGFEETP